MVSDNVSDILTRIRNSILVRHRIVEIPATKTSFAILNILKEEGFIENFEIYTKTVTKYFLLYLKYFDHKSKPVISKMKRISKPGLRIYKNSKTLPFILNNLGFAIISTSKGIMTNHKAKNLGIGGEILCYIW